MGEHKFEVGMRAGVARAFPCDGIEKEDVLRLLGEDRDNFKVMVERTRKSLSVWVGHPVPLPADPPSVGVPAKGTVVQSVLMRPAGLGPASVAHDYAQQQMAAQQQGQGRGICGYVSDDEHAALKAELEKERVARKQFGERVRELQGELAAAQGHNRYGDVLGERDKLRREKADLETQVAYLSRELVLAKGRAKGAR